MHGKIFRNNKPVKFFAVALVAIAVVLLAHQGSRAATLRVQHVTHSTASGANVVPIRFSCAAPNS